MSQQMPSQGSYGQAISSQNTLLPPRTRARLSSMHDDAAHRGLSTSNLSVNEARDLAMERMQAEAAALQATNVVSVSLSQGNYEWESHVIEFFVLGTAVVPLANDHPMPTPSFTLSLNS